MQIKSGKHLGVVRSWIQRKALNGERVGFGSHEFLNLKPLTACDMDRLAQDIRDATIREALKKLPDLCDDFQPWGNNCVNVCNTCGHDEWWHRERSMLE